MPYEFVLSKFADNLAGYPENFNSFRHSCYSPGLFICLILDKYNLNWQEEYLDSGKHLYEFFLEKVSVPKEHIDLKNLDLTVADYLADTELTRRKDSLDTFLNSQGYKIVLKGSMGLAGFNPMQVVPYQESILHQTFLGLKLNSQALFIKGQSLSTQGNVPWEFKEVIFFRDEKPTINDGIVSVNGIGELKGSVEIQNNTYYINLS